VVRIRLAVCAVVLSGLLVGASVPASAAPAVNVNTAFAALATYTFPGFGPSEDTWSGSTVTLGPSPLLASLTVSWSAGIEACATSPGTYGAMFTLDDHKGDTMVGTNYCVTTPSNFTVTVVSATGSYAPALDHTGTLSFLVQPEPLIFDVSTPLPLIGTLTVRA